MVLRGVHSIRKSLEKIFPRSSKIYFLVKVRVGKRRLFYAPIGKRHIRQMQDLQYKELSDTQSIIITMFRCYENKEIEGMYISYLVSIKPLQQA
jgi:hypothetical protein